MKRFLSLSFSLAFFILCGASFAEQPRKNASGGPAITFVELGSVNCIPCKAMQPVMKSIEQKYKGKVKVVFYDVWTEAGAPYARSYGIQAIPTQVFLDENGKEFFRHTGFYPEAEIDRVIRARGIKP